MTRTSSMRPMPSRLTVRSELPKTAMSLPGWRFSSLTRAATSSPMMLVGSQVACRRERETTILAMPFILSATLGSSCRAAGVGQ